MSITFDLPRDLEEELRNQLGDLNNQAKEAFAVELYRQRKLTNFQLSKILDLSRFEIDEVLKRHEVYYPLTAADVAYEAEELRQLRLSHDHRR